MELRPGELRIYKSKEAVEGGKKPVSTHRLTEDYELCDSAWYIESRQLNEDEDEDERRRGRGKGNGKKIEKIEPWGTVLRLGDSDSVVRHHRLWDLREEDEEMVIFKADTEAEDKAWRHAIHRAVRVRTYPSLQPLSLTLNPNPQL